MHALIRAVGGGVGACSEGELLAGERGAGWATARISEARALLESVARDLAKEHKRRMRAGECTPYAEDNENV